MRHILLFCLILVSACAHPQPVLPPPPVERAAAKPLPPPPPPVLPENPNAPPLSILVMPLHAEANLKGSAHALDEMILATIAHFKRYQVLGPEDLNALLGVEKLKDAMGCDDVSCAAEIGGALGAPYLVTGELSGLGEEVVLSLRLLDTKGAKILSRGAARGSLSANDLSDMMREAVQETFGIAVTEVAHSHSAAITPPQENTPLGLTFQTVMNELSKRAANKDYVHVMLDLDAYAAQSISAPPGTDVREVLAFWRSFACYMLQRPRCVQHAAQEYVRQWPDGMYAATVKSYAEQIGILEQQKTTREAQLEVQLQQIESRRRAGQVSDDQALELSASVATTQLAFARAAAFYESLMNRSANNDQRWFAFVEQAAVAHEVGQSYDKARALLQSAQLRNSNLFRNRGLGLILARLPQE